MKKQEYETIDKMLSSSDKESKVLAYTILRNNPTKKNKSILNKISLFDRIQDYSDVCKELETKELTIQDFNFLPVKQRKKALAQHKIQNLELLFNGKWRIDWKDPNQYKWYPYFSVTGLGGLLFSFSSYRYVSFDAGAGFYKDPKTSNFVGKTFIDIYQDLL